MEPIDSQRWSTLSFIEQMANIGSEVGRARKWKGKGDEKRAEGAFVRALDLFDVTIKCARLGQPTRGAALKELCRARELFVGSYLENDFDNLAYLDKYFGQFAFAVRSHLPK